jgi:hypothetical protein
MFSEKYFISGCIVCGDIEVERVPDNEAQFWSVYRKMEDGTDRWVQDFITRPLAEDFIRELGKKPDSNKAFLYNIHGIKCDNPSCSYNDSAVPLEDYAQWLNRPCPLCGGNLLTQKDYDAVLSYIESVAIANQLIGNVTLPPSLKRKRYRMSLNGSGNGSLEQLPDGEKFDWE